MEAPCKNCDKHGCGSHHDECEKYQEFKKRKMEMSRERRKQMGVSAPRRKWVAKTPENSPTKCHKK